MPSLIVHQGDAVEQRGSSLVACRQSNADQQGTGAVQLLHKPVQGFRLLRQLRGPEKKITGWVSPEGQFRRQQQGRSHGFRLPGCRKNPFRIAAQITHQGIELGQSEAHQQRLEEFRP